MLNQVSQIKEGESAWSDISDCRGLCFGCNKNVDIAWGFLCTATINGKSCPSRCPTAREMLIVYKPDESSPSLVDTLNEVCCMDMLPISMQSFKRAVVHSYMHLLYELVYVNATAY